MSGLLEQRRCMQAGGASCPPECEATCEATEVEQET